MKNKTKLSKRIVAFFVFMIFTFNSFATIISDNDGITFVTKGEFEALKSGFDSQVTNYGKSITEKINGVIASYLAGVSKSYEESCEISDALFWPVRCWHTDRFSNETRNIDIKYNAAVHMGRDWHNADFSFEYDNSATSNIKDFIVIDETSQKVVNVSENTKFEGDIGQVGYDFRTGATETSFQGHFAFWIFWNGNNYTSHSSRHISNTELEVAGISDFQVESYYKTTDNMQLRNNYVFWVWGVAPSNYAMYWNKATFDKCPSGSETYTNEAGVEQAKFWDSNIFITGDLKKINTITDNASTLVPILNKKSDGILYAYTVKIPNKGYVKDYKSTAEKAQMQKKWVTYGASGAVNKTKDCCILGVCYPAFCLFSTGHSGASAKPWYQTSGVAASNLKYDVIDTSTGVVSTLAICDGIYLTTLSNNGDVIAKLKYSKTGSNTKRIIFQKAPISGDGSSASAANIYNIEYGGTTSTSITVPGDTEEIELRLKGAEKGEKIYIKTFCNSDFEYTQKPELTLIVA